MKSGSSTSKSSLRKALRVCLEEKNENELLTAAISARDRLISTDAWSSSRSLLVYLSFGSELDADPVIVSALHEGKAVYAPRIVGGSMEFRRIRSLGTELEAGPLGIRSPGASPGKWLSSSYSSALVLVPGLAFDLSGGRLGRGGGYFDRFISKIRSEPHVSGDTLIRFLGYAYEFQIVPKVPMDETDEYLDGIVTDVKVRLF